jgi:hypothetical protein
MSILLVGLLVVIWWIGVWGLIETLLGDLIKKNPLAVYGSMVAFVIVIIYLKPELLEHFV